MDARQRVRSIVASLVPFIAIAIVFLIARRLVLGQAQLRFAWQPGWEYPLDLPAGHPS